LLNGIRDVQQQLLAPLNHENRSTASSTQPDYFDAFATAWQKIDRSPQGAEKGSHRTLVANPDRPIRI
jgi:hypothetical protein